MRYTRISDFGVGLESGVNLTDAIKALYEIEETAKLCGVRGVDEIQALLLELVYQEGKHRIRELIRDHMDRALVAGRRNRERRNVRGVCGGCVNFVPKARGARTGHCAVRKHVDRCGQVIGEHLPVYFKRLRCRGDYKEREQEDMEETKGEKV